MMSAKPPCPFALRQWPLAILFLFLALTPVQAAKLIEAGWDMPDTRYLRDHLAAMEKCPFDGVVISAVGIRDDTKPCRLCEAFSTEHWNRDWFRNCRADLQACKFRRFTDNFLLVGANPGNVDWSDDVGWREVVAHWRLAARLARQGGLKGILFDPEPYTKPYAQFRFSANPDQSRNLALARRHGRDVMHAVAKEYPNITLFCFFANSVQPEDSYGFLPAFLDGWLDTTPVTVTIVDGCESAYLYNTKTQFLEATAKIKGDCQQYVSPENRAKYRSQVQVSFGIYLDAYANPPTSHWYVPGQTDALCANLTTAGRLADEYVWVWGEKSRWWPTPTWNEALPGSEAELAFARDPLGCARDQIGRTATPVALTNDWLVWQSDQSHGRFSWIPQLGSLRVEQTADGCFNQSIAAQPGEHYAVQAHCRTEGAGRASILVRWKTADNQWTAETRNIWLTPDKTGEIFGAVTVPESVGRLAVLLYVKGQQTSRDKAEFHDVRLYKLNRQITRPAPPAPR